MEDLSKLELRIPQFIKEDYPQFALFVEKYYEWLSSTHLGDARHLVEWKDIDTTIDSFTEYYVNQYLEDFPQETVASKRRVIKHSKELFRAKGSERSISGLFGILYGENPSLAYPKDNVMRASDSKWVYLNTIKVTSNGSRLSEIIGHEIFGLTSGARAFVENFVYGFFGTTQFIELNLSNIQGTFLPNEVIRCVLDDGFLLDETVFPVVSSATITNPGLLYVEETTVPVTGGDGSGISCKIKETSRGGFYDVSLGSGGLNYQVGDKFHWTDGGGVGVEVKVTSVAVGSGSILSVALVNPGSGYKTVPTNMTTTSSNGTGASLTLHTNNIGKIKKIEFTNFGVGYSVLPTFDLSGIGNGLATATGVIGAHSIYSGVYSQTESVLGIESNRIQDGYYYQDFSYVIKSGVSINTYRDILKKLVHPAGMIVFGEVTVEEKVEVSLFGGVAGRIDENLGRMFRCVIKQISTSATHQVNTVGKDQVVFVEKYKDSTTTLNREMDRWMKFNFTSRCLAHVADLVIQDYSMQPEININNYTQNMNIQPDLVVDYLLVNYVTTEAGAIVNTESSDRIRT